MRARCPTLICCLLSLALLLPWPATAHPPAIVNQATEKAMGEEIADFRQRMATAIRAKDQAKLRKMYADSHRHTDETGQTEDKTRRIAAALAGEAMIETAPVDDLKVSMTNGWAAIVTGRSPMRTRSGGTSYLVRWTAVYVRVGDDWQLAASHATRLP